MPTYGNGRPLWHKVRRWLAPMGMTGMRSVVMAVVLLMPARASWGGVLFLTLLPVRPHPCGNLTENLLESDLVPWEPLDIVERLNVNKPVWGYCGQSIQSIVPGIRKMRSNGRRDLMGFEEVHNLVPFPLKVWVHLPNRGETVQMFRVVFAEEVNNKMDAILWLFFLDFLRKSCEQL